MKQNNFNKQKTVLIVRNAYRWQFGGAEQLSYNFAVALKKAGWRPIVVTRVPELLKNCKAAGIITHKNIWLKIASRRFMLAYLILSPILLGQYIWIALRYRAGLMLLGSRDDQVFASLAGKLLRLPTVWIDHADLKTILVHPGVKSLYLRAMRLADKIIMVSKAEQVKILAVIPPEYQSLQNKFVLINNGALKKAGKPRPRPKGTVVLYVGRLEADKGVFEILKAAELVLRQHPDTYFWLVGKGRAENKIKNIIAQKELEQNVVLWGHQDDVGSFFSTSDLFIYPTHHDASPLAPVEALLAGLPVVASRIGGIPEVIDASCGLLVESKNPTQLAEAIAKLASDKQLLSRLKKGALKRGQPFELNRMVKQKYIPLFEEVIGS